MPFRHWINRLRRRLAATDTGHDFIDACCHRLGGRLRAGPPPERQR